MPHKDLATVVMSSALESRHNIREGPVVLSANTNRNVRGVHKFADFLWSACRVQLHFVLSSRAHKQFDHTPYCVAIPWEGIHYQLLQALGVVVAQYLRTQNQRSEQVM